MKRLAWRPILLALACLAQIAVPTSMILNAEATLEEGELFRFRTAPVDPVDLVRGRYLALRFRESQGPPQDSEPFLPGETVYALLDRDAEGFATVVGVAHREPADIAYLEVVAQVARPDAVLFRFPIDRYYLPEEQAPEAERLYRTTSGASWAEIRVRDGHAVIEDLVIEGKSIAEHFEAAQ